MLVCRHRLLAWASALLVALSGATALAAPPKVKHTEQGQEITPDTKDKTFDEATRKKVRFHMDFDKVDILEVIKAIAQWTRKNFILPDNIRGKITIIGPTDVTAEEAYNAFVAALEVNNFTPCPAGNFFKIIPKKDCMKDGGPLNIDGGPPLPTNEAVATKMFRLHYSDADPIKNVIQQFITREGEIVAFPPDILIVSDDATNIARVERFIKALDMPGSQDEINVVQIYHASAQEMSAMLLQIFQAQGGQQGAAGQHRPQMAVPAGSVVTATPGQAGAEAKPGEGGASGAATVSKIIPDERTNKLIIIASARAFVRINELVKKLDVPTNSTQVHVVALANASAEEVATVLSNLASGASAARKRGGAGAAGAAAVPGAPTTPEGGGAAFVGEVKVTADKSTNSLLIIAAPNDYANMVKVIEQLDIRRRQVFIEAVIMEVKLNGENSHSVDLHSGYGIENVQLPGTDSSTVPILAGSELSSPGASLGLTGLASLSGFLAGIQGPPIKVDGLNITLPSFGVVLNALQKNSDVNVISTPHILTSDNSDAEIAVGSTVPFQTAVPAFGGLSSLASLGSTASTGTSALGLGGLGLGGFGLGGLAPIQRQPVELRLKIKPHINDSGNVKLEIDEQVEEISSNDPQRGPTTSKRSIKTTVFAKDQSTVVIGGLIQDRITRAETKFPVLGSIPLLGWFFRSESETKERTNLLLFLTPYVIQDQSDFRAIFERKMKERREFLARFFGTEDQYVANMDYSRKRGPLGLMHQTVRDEFSKAENGGTGGKTEHVIMGGQPAQETTTQQAAPAMATEPAATPAPTGDAMQPGAQSAAPEMTPPPAAALPPAPQGGQP